MSRHSAKAIMQRIEALAKISEEPGRLTRTFASPAMRRANDLVAAWMRAAGMKTLVDAMGNLIGHYASKHEDGRWQMKDSKNPSSILNSQSSPPLLLLGSHLDTVRNAGKFDGPLGVILAIACVEHLRRQKIRLPFAIEVVGFADEEGVRYQTAYLGSNVLTGTFDEKNLSRKDVDGISMADAIKHFGGDPAKIKPAKLNPKNLLGYVEAHIEQGPVLEKKNLAVGIVSAIAGQSRFKINFTGHAGHAGTTPMNLRKDALCAAAEFIVAAEKYARQTAGLVATVGQIHAAPGASNVIPGEVNLTLDVRHQTDSARQTACAALQKIARQIAVARKIKFSRQLVQQTDSVPCAPELSALLKRAVKKFQPRALQLPSGAGHDAAVMARITPAAMLFIRCKNGVSHHPDESAKLEDVSVALAVMNEFILQLAQTS